jgi:hypothetical protein
VIKGSRIRPEISNMPKRDRVTRPWLGFVVVRDCFLPFQTRMSQSYGPQSIAHL